MIRNIKEFKYNIDVIALSIINDIGEKIKEIIQDYIREYYTEYTPEMYDRTYSFFNSLIKTEPKITSTGYEIEIYIDMNHMYYNGWTMEQTVDQASQGLHGDIKVGDMRFWDDALDEIRKNDIISGRFIRYLKKKGIKINAK